MFFQATMKTEERPQLHLTKELLLLYSLCLPSFCAKSFGCVTVKQKPIRQHISESKYEYLGSRFLFLTGNPLMTSRPQLWPHRQTKELKACDIKKTMIHDNPGRA